MTTVLVIGAGSAGCVLASRLSEHPLLDVLLLEAGPDHAGTPVAAQLASANWMDAMAAPVAFDQRMVASRRDGDTVRQYHRGTGLGGSASVNAMLALPGLPSDYDRWAREHGLDEWSWEHVAPVVERLQRDLVRSSPAEGTVLDRALLDAAPALGLPGDVDTMTPDDGAGMLWRHADATGRRSSRERYLDPARSRPNLEVRTGARVSRLLLEGTRAVGVVLLDGTEIRADEVVLAAGTFETPAILLRSGCPLPGVGRNLQDHPAASIMVRLRDEVPTRAPGAPCIGAVLRTSSSRGTGDIHVLPMLGALSADPPHDGVLMAAVMTVTSTGEVRLDPDDPEGPPVIAERMLATEHDRQVMREAVRTVLALLDSPAMQELVAEAVLDADGTPAAALHDDAAYERWLEGALGDYFHAVGTARMGRADDPSAVVDQHGRVHGWQGVRVVDCSVLPDVPAANTHLPVVMVAERLAAALLDDLTRAAPPRSAVTPATPATPVTPVTPVPRGDLR